MKRLNKNCRVGEIENVANHLISAYDLRSITDARLADYIARLRDKAATLSVAIKRVKTLSNLDDLDNVRDGFWMDFVAIVYGYSRSPLAHLRTAAAVLLPVTERYNADVMNATYANQSALLNSLFKELSATEMQAAAAQLPGVPEIIASLETAQTNFYNAQVQLYDAHAEEAKQPTATNVKKEVLALINGELLPYLEFQRAYASTEFEKYCAAVEEILF